MALREKQTVCVWSEMNSSRFWQEPNSIVTVYVVLAPTCNNQPRNVPVPHTAKYPYNSECALFPNKTARSAKCMPRIMQDPGHYIVATCIYSQVCCVLVTTGRDQANVTWRRSKRQSCVPHIADSLLGGGCWIFWVGWWEQSPVAL